MGWKDTAETELGLLLTETDGTWGAGTEAGLPANAMGPPIDGGDEPVVLLTSVSCASAGNCTSVGSYDAGPDTSTSGGDQEGLLLSQTGGTWATGTQASLPANADADPVASLNSVSCASVENCSAVGYYAGSGAFAGLLLTDTDGTWSASTAGLPTGTDDGPPVVLSSVSCASAQNCAAVGSYDAELYLSHGLLIDSTPSATTSAPPPPASGVPPTSVPTSSVPPPEVGPITPSNGQVTAALSRVGAPSGSNANIGALLKHGSYVFAFIPPSAGKLAIAWYQVPAGAHIARAPEPVLVASGSKTFTGSRSAEITVKLTVAGRRLLKRSKHLKLTAIVSFTPMGGKKISTQRRFTVKR